MRHEVFINTSNGRHTICIDDDFCQSLSVPVRGNEEIVSLFVASWIALLADSPLNPEQKPLQTYRRFLNRIRRDGIKATVLGFSDLAHQLVSQHTLMGSDSSIGAWIDGFKDTPVFFEYNRYFKTGDVKLLEFLYTFLNFGKKLDYVDEDFNETAFRSWLDIEKRLDDLELPIEHTDALHQILETVLPPFSWRDLRPRFGPGSVQERGVRGRIDKLCNLRFDYLIDRFLLHGHIGMYGYGDESGVSAAKIIPDLSSWTPARGVSSRCARLKFVPKNLKVSRSICMEPNTMMFFQQAVAERFIELIGDSFLSIFIDIKDQQRNQQLALAGSYTSEIDTIDLAAASDSISFELVKKVFPPSWLIPMIATRSHSAILPNGEFLHLKKFAPMGSALCFPTQCIIFASVCIYAACLYTYEVENVHIDFLDWLNPSVIRRVIGSFSITPGYYRGCFQPLAVYGDDICVDRRLTDIIKSILSDLGLVVNTAKSFCGSQSFRESCGKFYLDGNDITPLYFRIKDVKSKLGASHVVSQVHLINESRRKCYKSLYRFLHNSIMTWGCRKSFQEKGSTKNSIPYVSDPLQFGIFVNTVPKNSHLRSRYNEGYQRDEVRAWTISYDHKEQPGNLLYLVDSYEHMRWWASRGEHYTPEVSTSVARYDTGGAGLRWRWIPS